MIMGYVWAYACTRMCMTAYKCVCVCVRAQDPEPVLLSSSLCLPLRPNVSPLFNDREETYLILHL
jgi:hypothetical protein